MIGYLDDLIITPVGIAVAIRLIPAEVMAEAREKAAAEHQGQNAPQQVYAVGVVVLWIVVLVAAVWRVWIFLRN